jgi:hypothetical protein
MRSLSVVAVFLTLCGAACGSSSDLGDTQDVLDTVLEEPSPALEDWETAGTLDPAELTTSEDGLAANTCIRVPPAGSCWHSFGGRYASGACSGSYQCCSGKFAPMGTCGACSCTETTGSLGCVPPTQGTQVCFAAFVGTQEVLPSTLRTRMTGLSWHSGCPVSLDNLRLLKMSYWDFAGVVRQGRMVVAASVAGNVLKVFKRMYEMRFPIQQMKLVDDFGADDDRSMAANNTSAFNCRRITGGTSWSVHSFGKAIDINPIQNPYAKGSTVLPPAGAPFVERRKGVKGMILNPGPVTGAFAYRGWTWGGSWTTLKDYQHFERP